jgi:hypothetical protein
LFKSNFSKKYIIYSGSYSYKPNKIAIDYLINKVMPYFKKKNYNINLMLTGKNFPKHIKKKKYNIQKKSKKKYIELLYKK